MTLLSLLFPWPLSPIHTHINSLHPSPWTLSRTALVLLPEESELRHSFITTSTWELRKLRLEKANSMLEGCRASAVTWRWEASKWECSPQARLPPGTQRPCALPLPLSPVNLQKLRTYQALCENSILHVFKELREKTQLNVEFYRANYVGKFGSIQAVNQSLECTMCYLLPC